MPRRKTPDPLAAALGRRLRVLRSQQGLTMEMLACKSNVAKGHLSSTERGLCIPTIRTVKLLADGLGVGFLDLFKFPEEDARQFLNIAAKPRSSRTVATRRKMVPGRARAKQARIAKRKPRRKL